MTIQGRIIRILDKRTAIINLGEKDGITHESVFSVIGQAEPIVDPLTGNELGQLAVVKTKLKADHVDEKFTIATTRWTEFGPNPAFLSLSAALGGLFKTETIDQGEMLIDERDIQPWKAQAELPVRVGDRVDVEVKIADDQVEKQLHDQSPKALASA